jgi:hypothetical protein
MVCIPWHPAGVHTSFLFQRHAHSSRPSHLTDHPQLGKLAVAVAAGVVAVARLLGADPGGLPPTRLLVAKPEAIATTLFYLL